MRSAADAKVLYPTEAALCAAFVREFNRVDGWTCYPETGGFDVLVAHADGRQIGVEAKLQLNAKVVDQILPELHSYRYDDTGPNHRLVIVPYISDGAAGIAKVLRMLGVEVWEAQECWPRDERPFDIRNKVIHGDHPNVWYSAWYDWNHINPIKLPATVPEVPAGVPAPRRLTPWVEGALKVLAHLELHGRIRAKDIAGYGISPTMWTQHWLDRCEDRGWWTDNLDTPRHHAQRHPLAYAAAREHVSKQPKDEK